MHKSMFQKLNPIRVWGALFVAAATAVGHAAPDTNAPSAKPPVDPETAYRQSIEDRAAGILSVLDLTDHAKSIKVHDLLIAQYRSLRDWHDAQDARRKAATGDEAQQIESSLKTLHDQFIGKLSAELNPSQVEKVKDKMTYGTVEVTYKAYREIVPNLTEQDKAKILELLKEGREEAMDGGSQKEKAAIFKKYKGKINNYLDAHGHNVKQAYKDWGAKQKAVKTSATTNSPTLD